METTSAYKTLRQAMTAEKSKNFVNRSFGH